MTLGDLRRSKNLSQRRVAETIHVSTQTIRNWEIGRSEPLLKIRQVYALCELLQCSLKELDAAAAETPVLVRKKRKRRNRKG